MTWIGVLWHLIGMLTEVGPAGLLAGSAVMAGVLLTAVFAARVLRGAVTDRPDPRAAGRGIRERDSRVGVPRHRDPDAPGRSRPRAPTALPAAA